MTRYFSLSALVAIAALVPSSYAREQQDFHERVKNAVTRTDKDLGTYVHRDNLSGEPRDRFDAAVKDLSALRDAIAAGQWDGAKERLEHAIDNIDFVVQHAPIGEQEKQTLGIDLYTLRDIRDGWKP